MKNKVIIHLKPFYSYATIITSSLTRFHWLQYFDLTYCTSITLIDFISVILVLIYLYSRREWFSITIILAKDSHNTIFIVLYKK